MSQDNFYVFGFTPEEQERLFGEVTVRQLDLSDITHQQVIFVHLRNVRAFTQAADILPPALLVLPKGMSAPPKDVDASTFFDEVLMEDDREEIRFFLTCDHWPRLLDLVSNTNAHDIPSFPDEEMKHISECRLCQSQFEKAFGHKLWASSLFKSINTPKNENN